MAKGLASKLRTGAMVGLAALAVAAPMKAKGNLVYDSGYQSVTNVVADGQLVLDYRQTIETADTDGDGTFESYLSTLDAYNHSQGGANENKTFFMQNIDADLAGRGATDLKTDWLNWTYETTGTDTGRFIMPGSGEWPLFQGTRDNFSYTIPINQVAGWETVNASMVANAGSVNFAFQAPVAIPEPMTFGLLASGVGVLLAGRRVKEYYRQK